MKELNLHMPFERQVEERFNAQRLAEMRFKGIESLLLGVILVLVWFTLPNMLRYFDSTVGTVDQSIWMLIVLSLLSFLMVVGMSWYMLSWSWKALGLPGINVMVLQFKDLMLWQQLGFFLCCFALLLLAGVLSLTAIM